MAEENRAFLVTKVSQYVQRHELLSAGDRVIVGLSGGADSVCLLLVLQALSAQIPLSLCAVHVEHGIRGMEALEDADFCRRLCETRGIPFHMVHCDVPALAAREGLSLEEAGRKARYEAFDGVYREWNGSGIAVAHHLEDQAETLLLNLFRGTHLAGMQGMKPRQGRVIRPLLEVTRGEIEAWLLQQGIVWRTDSTNLTDDYARNRIRHHILPEAQKINPAAAEHLSEACSAVQEVLGYVESAANSLYTCFVTEPEAGRVVLDAAGLSGQPPVLVRFVLKKAYTACCGQNKDAGKVHYEALMKLLSGETGKRISLPHRVQAEKVYDQLLLCVAPEEKQEEKEAAYDLPVPGSLVLPDGRYLKAELEDFKKNTGIPIKTYTKWMDYDTIKRSLMLRTRRPGDYLIINGQGGRKKLKDYFIDEKIERSERDRIWLLADGSHILWVIGHRMSADCKVTPKTERILKIQADGGVWNE